MSGILALDPGAKRCGWAHLDETNRGLELYNSGILGMDRVVGGQKMVYQEFRLALIRYWIMHADELIRSCEPEALVSETVPVVGGGNFVLAADSQLVGTVTTTVQAVAFSNDLEVYQIGATTVKKQIGGVKSASKVKVRNGVLSFFPELEKRRKEFVKVFDETDAIAIGLTHLGHSI